MFGFVFRIFWRILVGLIAVGLAVITYEVLFPYLDARMPAILVVIIMYVLAAYIGIPFLVRLWRLVLKPNHLPIYATSRDGWSSDPVNVAFICKSRDDLIAAMQEAGWHQADKATFSTAAREAWALVMKRSYPTAPFSNLFLFGRKQDIGFQIQTGKNPSPRHRHHIRLWQLESEDTPHEHATFWESIFQLFQRRKQQIWIAAATHDVKPFAFRVQNLQVTHGIDPDTNRERDYVIKTLSDKGLVKRIETVTSGEPLQFKGQTFGIRIVVDGKLQVVELKRRRAI